MHAGLPGDDVSEMTGAVLVRRELSHVLMAITKAGWLVGLVN